LKKEDMEPSEKIPKALNPGLWKEITPTWFNWLRWFLTLGAVGYVARKTQNTGLYVIYGISYVAFYMFFTNSISDLLKIKVVKNRALNTILSLVLALAVLLVTRPIVDQSIEALLKG
jgi:hypothetical protein